MRAMKKMEPDRLAAAERGSRNSAATIDTDPPAPTPREQELSQQKTVGPISWKRIGFAVLAVLLGMITVFIWNRYSSGDKTDPVPASGPTVLAPDAPSAPTTLTLKPLAPPSKATTAKATTTIPAPAPTTPPSNGGCVKITQDWVDIQPWATKRDVSENQINSFRRDPALANSIDCKSNGAKTKWIDANTLDISECCIK